MQYCHCLLYRPGQNSCCNGGGTLEARFHLWWQQIKKNRVTILVVASILVVAIALIIVGYRFDWTGFNGKNKSGKTLWDWLQLLIIPAVLAVAGYVINVTISRGEQAATEQRAKSEREAVEKRAETERKIAEERSTRDSSNTDIDCFKQIRWNSFRRC